MRHIWRAGITALLLASLAAAYGGAVADASVTGSKASSTKTVTWDLPAGEPGSLDPALAGTSSASVPVSNMCESLMQYTSSGKLVPWLASAVTQPNPKTAVFTIRAGVKFWNGKPMTPADVVASLTRQMTPALGGAWTDPWFTAVKSITRTGSDQVTVTFKQPDAVFKEIMATTAGDISTAAYVKSKGKEYGSSSGGLMCTGPYELVKWTPGQQIDMKANPGYWNKAHAAKVSSIAFDFITDANTLTDALLSGEIDGTYEVPVSSLGRLKSSKAGKLHLSRSVAFEIGTFTRKNGPLRNVNIRKALTVAITRNAIVKSIYDSSATPVWSINMPSLWGYGSQVFEKTYNSLPGSKANLSLARKLVKSAGAAASGTISLLVSSTNPTTQEIAAYIQSVAAGIGLHVKIDTTPPANFAQILFTPTELVKYDMLLDEGSWDVPDPIEALMFVAMPGSILDTSGFSNPTVTKLITEAEGTINLTKRAQLLDQATKIYQGKFFGELLIANPAERLFENRSVVGAPTSPLGYLYTPWATSLRIVK
jgi:peptide/nickel transport system substrate-binding protein